jgi:predicted ATP-dependent endonuclease of OLD family
LIGQRKIQLYEEIDESIIKNLVFQWTYPEGTFFGIPNTDSIKGMYRIRPNIFVVPSFPFNNDTFEYISIYKNEQVIEKYRELFKKNSLNTILQTIKENIADFVDINEIDNELIVSYGQKENPLKLPLKLMGDGFQSLIKMIFTFAQKDKIFLLEEPENCLHRGYNEYLTKIILQNIQTNQFIITTHNLEFLKSIIEQVKASELQDNFQIIRMNNIDGEIDCEILDFSEVEKEIDDLEIDLRGY